MKCFLRVPIKTAHTERTADEENVRLNEITLMNHLVELNNFNAGKLIHKILLVHGNQSQRPLTAQDVL